MASKLKQNSQKLFLMVQKKLSVQRRSNFADLAIDTDIINAGNGGKYYFYWVGWEPFHWIDTTLK